MQFYNDDTATSDRYWRIGVAAVRVVGFGR
jgi:hypothetical protein